MPTAYRQRKQDASFLLSGIKESWACHQKAHANVSHEAKLLLVVSDVPTSTPGSAGCLDITIYRGTTCAGPLSTGLCVLPKPRGSSTGILSPNSSSENDNLDDQERKRQRVNKKGENTKPVDHICANHLAPVDAAKPKIGSFNLAEAEDVCSRLCSPTAFRSHKATMGCHLDFRSRTFDFSHGHAIPLPAGFGKPLQGTIMSLQDIFNQELDETLGDSQRFWLASLIVKSALRHYDTGWWPESWTPEQLNFYDLDTGDLTDSLQTLHLSSRLPISPVSRDGDTVMALTEDTTARRSKGKEKLTATHVIARDMMDVGIRNLTLWGVGVTLLQIGLWRAIPWTDHVEVRQSVASLASFSRRYHDLTDKLINCDFGKGSKLQKWELQNEVYRSVVCELDETLEEFKKAGIWHL
ncbi:hypothetical protein G7Z17_g4824 [Cylindrodendrum hubeiense]|uniref:Uncharacterized protein n=1 Tax=Cylindrodendrum hubeiense TaxID=595255 RepID=A0A9P5HE66_9HYPO|nr:hypothetical protein G7Z17_g4824 [Cylindrodendrum hubeiense]